MTPSQLEHCTQLLAEVLTFRQPADAAVSAYFRQRNKLGRQDRHEIAETVFAAVRHYQKIAAALRRPHAQARKAALAALVLGRSVNISQLGGFIDEEEQNFLARLKARKTEFSDGLATAAELPQWLADRLLRHWDEAAVRRFGRSVSHGAPLDLRVNTLKARRDKVLAALHAQGLPAEATPYSPWGIRLHEKPALNRHPLFLDGTLEVQDEGSQLLALLTGAKRGEIVVDFCAGAGGKTLALGAQMANKGRLYAFDVAEKRLANLKPRMVRAGLTNIHPERIDSEHDPRLARLSGKADRVLVDAPCSGLGTLRRNPDLKYRQSADSIAKLVGQQHSILAAAAALVKPQGRLIYATCSILPEENGQQAERFLQENPDFFLLDCAALPETAKTGLDTGPFLQLDTAEHHTDGFFAAVFQRRA
ncbi:RsmB/NOP family class I SAM-dependent RNA methyltransferase [Neisseria leonii]|uniref:RsmB/NOP family class I SAM-dependent RNA methyltransferase n=1 Tax=Neisseria leonii TaxID=2995413 RepID=UPI00237C02DD|nr:RsmB/NOP family class I SAM-dependent RNA methyltransferase [Neisseria sp. 3986]MDD9324791.1 RsmB/NOP family class I SAM-dependent RNA methyltransferase [Neisseria sp. 3986]